MAVLQKLSYELLPTPFRHDGVDPWQARSALAQRVGESTGRFLAGEQVDQYMASGTLYSPLRSDRAMRRDDYYAELMQAGGCSPQLTVNMYECAGWAFLMRYAARKARAEQRGQRLLLQILDADVHGFQVSWSSNLYGKAGFGILNLLLYIPVGLADDAFDIGGGPVARAMMKFGAGLRRISKRLPHAPVAGPFFPEPARSAFRRAVQSSMLLEDQHEVYGHRFGADPWIAIGRDRADRDGAREYVLGSLAMSGYYGVAAVRVPEAANIRVETP